MVMTRERKRGRIDLIGCLLHGRARRRSIILLSMASYRPSSLLVMFFLCCMHTGVIWIVCCLVLSALCHRAWVSMFWLAFSCPLKLPRGDDVIAFGFLRCDWHNVFLSGTMIRIDCHPAWVSMLHLAFWCPLALFLGRLLCHHAWVSMLHLAFFVRWYYLVTLGSLCCDWPLLSSAYSSLD